MSKKEIQLEPVRTQTDHPDDEIELIDIFRIIWKWKYLIVGGIVACATAVFILNSMLPKIYQIETLIRPGILSLSEEGKRVYIDTPGNIKSLIESGIYNDRIINTLPNSNGERIPSDLNFKVTMFTNSSALKISYQTPKVDQGNEILDLLVKYLIEDYSDNVKFFQNEIDKDITIARSEIKKTRSIIKSNEIIINNIEKRIHELKTRKVFVSENTASLNEERNSLIIKDMSENNILTAILFSNTIQQNLQLEYDYEKEIKNIKLEKESELQIMSQLESVIQRQVAEIENLELKKNNIQNIRMLRKPYSSPHPVKPRKMFNVILSIFSGLIAMIFLSIFLEYLSKNSMFIASTNK